MTAKMIVEEFFHGEVSESWVRRNVPGKLDLGHRTKLWYSTDVQVWLESKRKEVS
jgi:hypothetical protein